MQWISTGVLFILTSSGFHVFSWKKCDYFEAIPVLMRSDGVRWFDRRAWARLHFSPAESWAVRALSECCLLNQGSETSVFLLCQNRACDRWVIFSPFPTVGQMSSTSRGYTEPCMHWYQLVCRKLMANVSSDTFKSFSFPPYSSYIQSKFKNFYY